MGKKKRNSERQKERRRDKSDLRRRMFHRKIEDERSLRGMVTRNEALAELGMRVDDTEEVYEADFHAAIPAPSVIASFPERSPSPDRIVRSASPLPLLHEARRRPVYSVAADIEHVRQCKAGMMELNFRVRKAASASLSRAIFEKTMRQVAVSLKK
jgi:hypothetical protein